MFSQRRCFFRDQRIFEYSEKTTRRKTTAEATYKNAKKSTAKPPYKRPEDRDRDTKFKQLKDLLKYGTISL